MEMKEIEKKQNNNNKTKQHKTKKQTTSMASRSDCAQAYKQHRVHEYDN